MSSGLGLRINSNEVESTRSRRDRVLGRRTRLDRHLGQSPGFTLRSGSAARVRRVRRLGQLLRRLLLVEDVGRASPKSAAAARAWATRARVSGHASPGARMLEVLGFRWRGWPVFMGAARVGCGGAGDRDSGPPRTRFRVWQAGHTRTRARP